MRASVQHALCLSLIIVFLSPVFYIWINALMNPKKEIHDLPDFLVKSTLGCSTVACLLLIPFCINNFIQGRIILGFVTLSVAIVTAIDAWLCYQEKYNKTINLYVVAPCFIIAITLLLSELGVAGSYWVPLAVLAFYFMLPEKNAWIFNIVFMLLIMPIAWNVLEQSTAIRFTGALIGVSFFAFISLREINKLHYHLKKQAVTDTLTGLYNRALLQDSLETAIHQSLRAQTPISLIMIDIDHFKEINDRYGHDIGDTTLKAISNYLKKYFRESDMVFRIGGEEFLILLHNTNKTDCLAVSEKLREGIEQLSPTLDCRVTASIGISSFQPEMNWKDWMKLCDRNLYRAKSNGRNQVAV